MRFRKKPIIIEAFRTDWDIKDWPEWANEQKQNILRGEVYDHLHSTYIKFKRGDWIIKGVDAELYPITADILAKTYDCLDVAWDTNLVKEVDGK